MKEKFSDMGEYHDPELRLERTDIAQQDFNKHVSPIFVQEVVNQVEREVGSELKINPNRTVTEIKMMALHRFLDLVKKDLLSESEADKCIKRFFEQVDYFYGR